MSYPDHVVDLDMLSAMKDRGVTRATFHNNGQIASVDFGPLSADNSTQHENPNPDAATPTRRTTGGRLVPRVPISADNQ